MPTVWSAVTAMALATVLVALLAGLRPAGWQLSAICAGVAAFLVDREPAHRRERCPRLGARAATPWSLAWFVTTFRENRAEVKGERA